MNQQSNLQFKIYLTKKFWELFNCFTWIARSSSRRSVSLIYRLTKSFSHSMTHKFY